MVGRAQWCTFKALNPVHEDERDKYTRLRQLDTHPRASLERTFQIGCAFEVVMR